jgi:hypothetical protein
MPGITQEPDVPGPRVVTGTGKPAPRVYLVILAVLETIFDFVLGPPPPGGPGGGSGLTFSRGNQWFLVDSGPDPGGNVFLIFILALSAAR